MAITADDRLVMRSGVRLHFTTVRRERVCQLTSCRFNQSVSCAGSAFPREACAGWPSSASNAFSLPARIAQPTSQSPPAPRGHSFPSSEARTQPSTSKTRKIVQSSALISLRHCKSKRFAKRPRDFPEKLAYGSAKSGETGGEDGDRRLFRSRLGQMIDLAHPLVRLA